MNTALQKSIRERTKLSYNWLELRYQRKLNNERIRSIPYGVKDCQMRERCTQKSLREVQKQKERKKKKIKRKADTVRKEMLEIRITDKREEPIGIGGDTVQSLTLSGRFFRREADYLQCWFLGVLLFTLLLWEPSSESLPRASSRNILRARGLWTKSESWVLKQSAWNLHSPETAVFIPGWKSSLTSGS